MPGPFTIVTLLDDDKDEFPIAIEGHATDESWAFDLAMRKANLLIEDGAWRPAGRLTFGGMEAR